MTHYTTYIKGILIMFKYIEDFIKYVQLNMYLPLQKLFICKD